MLWRIAADTHEQRIGIMACVAHPELATNVSISSSFGATLLRQGFGGHSASRYRFAELVLRSAPREAEWRMGWDSNPRCACTHAGFQDRCLKPLGHPSGMRLLLRPRRRVHIRPPP